MNIRAKEIRVGDSIAYNRQGIGWTRVEVRYVSRTKSGDPAVVIAPGGPEHQAKAWTEGSEGVGRLPRA